MKTKIVHRTIRDKNGKYVCQVRLPSAGRVAEECTAAEAGVGVPVITKKGR